MKFGYGRVSTKDQNPERQLTKFRELGIEERFIFVEKQSGKDFERSRYQAMRLMVREGEPGCTGSAGKGLRRDYQRMEVHNTRTECRHCLPR